MLSVTEAAAQLGISRARVVYLCKAGRVVGARRRMRAGILQWAVPEPIRIRPGERPWHHGGEHAAGQKE